MSEEPEKDVSPLRLKRPAPVASAPMPSSPADAGGGLPGGDSKPADLASSPEAATDQPMALRRRLNIAAVTTETSASPAAPATDPAKPEDTPEVPLAIKLRVGAKPAPPPPPVVETPDPFASLENQGSAPLMPLPTPHPFPGKLTAGLGHVAGNNPAPQTGALPPFPVLSPPSALAGVSLPPLPAAVPGNSTPPPLPNLPAGLAAAKQAYKAAGGRKKSRLPLLILGVLLLGALGGAAYFFLGQSEPDVAVASSAPPPLAVQPAPPAAPPAPPPPVNVVLPPEPVAPVAEPAPAEPVIAATEPIPAPIPSGPVKPPPPPAPSAAFVRFSENMTISGVFQGTPSRAFINGRVVRSGDELDSALGIKFVGVDAVAKHLTLEERTGAQLRVKY